MDNCCLVGGADGCLCCDGWGLISGCWLNSLFMRVTVKEHENNGMPASLQLEQEVKRDDNTLVMVRKTSRAREAQQLLFDTW